MNQNGSSRVYDCKVASKRVSPNFSPTPSDYILSRFIPLTQLGTGAEGLTFKVLNNETNEVSAMKSRILEENSFQEILIGCRLAPTRIYTHCIVMPQLWAIVDKPVFLEGSNPILEDWINNPINQYIFDQFDKSDQILGLVFTMPRALQGSRPKGQL